MVAVPEQLDGDFQSAYRAHYSLLHRRSKRWLPPDEAEDAVQETFLRAWAHHGGEDPGAPWLLTVLRNLAIDRSRRKKADPVADLTPFERPNFDATPEADVILLEERRAVREAVRTLTEAQQEALRLREWHGMSHEKIAEALGTTVPSVESLLVRGRKRLRKVLDRAMGVVAWPLLWPLRRVRGTPAVEQAVAAAAPSAPTWAATIANVATAGVVLIASTGGSGGGQVFDPRRDAARVPAVSSQAPGVDVRDGTAVLIGSTDMVDRIAKDNGSPRSGAGANSTKGTETAADDKTSDGTAGQTGSGGSGGSTGGSTSGDTGGGGGVKPTADTPAVTGSDGGGATGATAEAPSEGDGGSTSGGEDPPVGGTNGDPGTTPSGNGDVGTGGNADDSCTTVAGVSTCGVGG